MDRVGVAKDGVGTNRRALYAGPVMAPHLAMPETAGEKCSRCRITFRDEAPPTAREGRRAHRCAWQVAAVGAAANTAELPEAGGVELLRCPDCGRRFWADPLGPDGRCAVGLLPEREERQ